MEELHDHFSFIFGSKTSGRWTWIRNNCGNRAIADINRTTSPGWPPYALAYIRKFKRGPSDEQDDSSSTNRGPTEVINRNLLPGTAVLIFAQNSHSILPNYGRWAVGDWGSMECFWRNI